MESRIDGCDEMQCVRGDCGCQCRWGSMDEDVEEEKEMEENEGIRVEKVMQSIQHGMMSEEIREQDQSMMLVQ